MRRLYVKDEGSQVAPLYGNKVRKYEFLLPNLAFPRVRKVLSHGAFGSNHCAYLALATRYGAFQPNGGAPEMELELSLYPQQITE